MSLAVVAVATRGLTPSDLLRATRADFGEHPVFATSPAGVAVSGVLAPESYPPGFDLAALNPFIEGRLRVLTVLLTAVYFVSVAAIGNIIVGAIRGSDRWPRPVAAMAGFLPGYLMLLAPLQLLFAAVPLRTASWIALLGVPVTAIMLHRRAIARHAGTLSRDRAALGRWGVVAAGVSVVIALALVHRLQTGRFFMTQDSSHWLLIAAVQQLQGPAGGHLAQWGQQSDEWVFNGPLMFWSRASRDLWFPIYVGQCLSLVSLLSLVFGLVYGFAWRRKALAGFVATASVFGSTVAIFPWIYITIIGGDNPAFTTGQVGRHIGIVAPWVALLLVGRHRRSVMIALGLATLGLGFTSAEVLLFVLAAVPAGIAWRTVRDRGVPRFDRRGLRIGLHLVPVCALAAMLYPFWSLHGVSPPIVGSLWWLLAAAAVALTGAAVLCIRTPNRGVMFDLRHALTWFALWLGTAGVGLVLANNMTHDLFHGRLRTQLGSVLPGYQGGVLLRSDLPTDLFDGLSLGFSGDACTFWNYCQSFANFLATFGFLFAIALATWLTFGPLTSEPAANARRAVWLLMVSALGLAFVIVIFSGSTGWLPTMLLSRVLEAPYYGLLMLAAMSFAESPSRVTAAVGTSVLLLWTLIPLVATEWPQQMVRNADWFLQRAGLS
ncbi:MAG: hypothetical protein ABW167_19770 [Baekduia sp.]